MMNDDEFASFRRSLAETIKHSLFDANLKLYLARVFDEFGIPELTAERRSLVRKCRAPLSYIGSLFSGSDYAAYQIAGRTVTQEKGQFLSLNFCRELKTLVLKQEFFSNAVSRWGMPESGFTYIKYLKHDEAIELIIKYKDSVKINQ